MLFLKTNMSAAAATTTTATTVQLQVKQLSLPLRFSGRLRKAADSRDPNTGPRGIAMPTIAAKDADVDTEV